MTDSQSLLLRPALYYPYIHIRPQHLDWLKETLLSFRQVRRMVPRNYELNDAPEVQRLRDVEVPGLGPMVAEEPLHAEHPSDAQRQLLESLEKLPPTQLAKFSRDRAAEEPGGADAFQIHRSKFVWDLLAFLERHQAGWEARRAARGDWVAVHPRMGEAIMSVMALAIAGAKQLNIVTTDGDVHRAPTSRTEADIFDALIERRTKSRLPRNRDQIVNGATQLIIGKQINLSWMSFNDVAAIVRECNDFQRFRVRLQELAADIAVADDPHERAKQISALAAAARAEWDDYRKTLGSFQRMFVDTTIEDGTWPALSMFGAAAAGYATLGVASIGAGLVVGLARVLTKTVQARRIAARDQPYRYLSRLTKAGAVLIADLPEAPSPHGKKQRA